MKRWRFPAGASPARQTLAGGAAGLREVVAVFNVTGAPGEARHEVADDEARFV